MKYSSGNLFLVGLMGAGKSTVGRQLAARLNKRFIDTDHEIESRTGVKISVIFEIEGEAGFRKRESEAIDTLTGASGIVLATGGGAVLAAGNRAALKSRGFTIYLAANLNDLWMRTRHDKSRPLLQTENPRRRLEELLEERDPLYREVADMVVETGRPSVQRLTALILDNLASRPECSGLLTSAVADARVPDTAE